VVSIEEKLAVQVRAASFQCGKPRHGGERSHRHHGSDERLTPFATRSLQETADGVLRRLNRSVSNHSNRRLLLDLIRRSRGRQDMTLDNSALSAAVARRAPVTSKLA
jgi:hypothetical protein